MNQTLPSSVSRLMRVALRGTSWCLAAAAVIVLLLSPARARAGGLRLAADLPEVTYNGLTRKLSAQRFVYVGVQWDRSEKGQPTAAHYQLFDLQERKVVDLPIPFSSLPRSHTDLLGRANPVGEVVHTDGQVTSLTYNATKGYEATATYFCQYDHRTRTFSELVKLTDWNDSQHLEDIGFDPLDRYFYYATALNPAGHVKEAGYTALVLGRIDLRTRAIDWTMEVELPKRDRPLKLNSGPKVFSADGRKLALVEYNDRGLQRNHPANPQQQVLVVDIPSKQVDRYPAPLTAYGVMFSRDNRYLLLGSNQTGEIVRIDLQKKAIDRRVKAKKLIHQLVPTPSGKSFLVLSNTQLASPKVVEVRRVADLSLQTSIPMRLLYAGNDGVAPYGIAGVGGRALLLPYVDAKGWAAKSGVRLYEVPDDVDSPEVEGSTGGDLATALGVIRGKQYADAHGLLYEDHPEDPRAPFAQFVTTRSGDVLFVGVLSQNTDDDYKVGRTKAVLVRLDPKGKLRWRRELTAKGFLDYGGGEVALTPDGGCVVHVVSYVHPARHPVTRLVKLDAKGKVLWDRRFRGTGGVKTPLGDRFELLPDGSVSITGRYYEDKYERVKHAWKGMVDAHGKIVLDQVDP